jgi:hypothetical protein
VTTDVQRLADEVINGDADAALARCRASPELAHAAGLAVGRLLDGWVASFPHERAWPSRQAAVRALGAVPGVDQAKLAEAFVWCCARSGLWSFSPLDVAVFDWAMEWAADAVYAAVEAAPSSGTRFLEDALWTYPDERANAWMVDLLERSPTKASFRFQDMRTGKMRRVWDGPQWTARLHAMCDTILSPVPGVAGQGPRDLLLFATLGMGGPPPRESSAAQVRLAGKYSPIATHTIARTVLANLRAYRSGDPADDVDLFWWDPTAGQTALLRCLLDFAGPRGARGPLVAAAHARGLVDDRLAAFLAADIPRPSWVDDDAVWEIDRVVRAGHVRLPDGDLSACDPYWAFEGVPSVEVLSPGRYPVDVTMAIHPHHGRQCAAAELIVDREVPVAAWEPVVMWAGADDHPGYQVEVGVGSFGATEAQLKGVVHDLAPDFPGSRGRLVELDHPEHGGIVMFSVGPQRQFCRTWRGLDEEGRVVRFYSDLGLLPIDPADGRAADAPEPRELSAAARHAAAAGAAPMPAPHPAVTAAEAGIPHERRRFRANDGRGLVVVLDVADPEHSWAEQELLWFRWDDTLVGQTLPVYEFLLAFSPA